MEKSQTKTETNKHNSVFRSSVRSHATHAIGELKNRSKISNFTAVLKYWEFSSRMRKHTTPIQMVQATSDAISFCEKEKREEILFERTFLFSWKYIFMKYFNNITKEIFRENAGEIKIRITHQKWFHPIFRVSCTLEKRGV